MAETVKIDIFADTSSIKDLKQQLLEARNQLSGLDKDSEGFQNVARRAGELKDQIKDVNEQVAIFASGSKFEQAGTALAQVKDNLMNLDFEGAAEKARSLTAIVKTISFGEATKGLKDLGSTFLSLGKALLTNPLFLIPAAIIGIISALGLLGPIIDGIKAIFNSLSDAAREFTDILGITNTKADKLAESQKKLREESNKQKEAIAEEGKAYISLLGQLTATNAGSEDRKTLIKDINAQYGTTLTNMSNEAEFQKQVNAEMDNYIKYLIAKYTLQANEDKIKKNIQTQMKIQEELNKSRGEEKRIIDEIASANERANKFALDFSQTGKANYQSAQTDIARLTFELEKQKNETGLITQNITNARQRFKSYAGAAKELSDTITELTNSGVKYNGATKATATDVKDTTNAISGLSLEIKKINSIETKPLELLPDTTNFLTWDEIYRENVAQMELQAAESTQGKIDLLNFQMEEEIRMTEATESEKLLIKKKYQTQIDAVVTDAAEYEKKINKDVAEAKIALANSASDFLNALNTKNKGILLAALAIEKASAIASVIIRAQEEIAGHAATAAANPANVATAGAAGLAQLATLTALTKVRAALSIATIAATGFNGAKSIVSSGGGSGGAGTVNSGSVTTPAQPSYQLFGTAGEANNVNAATGNKNQTINVNATVSVEQITDTQKKLAQINQSKTL
jgi:hypothetical protein